MKLSTERLTLQSMTRDDWPLFLRLNQDPEVIRYISDPRSEEEIRTRFEARLPEWHKHGEQWLCLVMREKAGGEAVGITGFRPMWLPCQQAEVGTAFCRPGTARATARSRCGRCWILASTPAASTS